MSGLPFDLDRLLNTALKAQKDGQERIAMTLSVTVQEAAQLTALLEEIRKKEAGV